MPFWNGDHIVSVLLATSVSKWKLSYWNIGKKSEKNLGCSSVLDPHKHSDLIHFHMVNWKGEDVKFQRPIYLPPNLACLFPLQWNFYSYLLLSIITSSNFSPVFLTFTCTCCFSHSKLLEGMPALNWNIYLSFSKLFFKDPHLLWPMHSIRWLTTALPKGIWEIE